MINYSSLPSPNQTLMEKNQIIGKTVYPNRQKEANTVINIVSSNVIYTAVLLCTDNP